MHRYSGYGDATGFENSVGVEFRASPRPCVALVKQGISSFVYCAYSDSQVMLQSSEVSLHRASAFQAPGPMLQGWIDGPRVVKKGVECHAFRCSVGQTSSSP